VLTTANMGAPMAIVAEVCTVHGSVSAMRGTLNLPMFTVKLSG
jgi:hypothetical protein